MTQRFTIVNVDDGNCDILIALLLPHVATEFLYVFHLQKELPGNGPLCVTDEIDTDVLSVRRHDIVRVLRKFNVTTARNRVSVQGQSVREGKL